MKVIYKLFSKWIFINDFFGQSYILGVFLNIFQNVSPCSFGYKLNFCSVQLIIQFVSKVIFPWYLPADSIGKSCHRKFLCMEIFIFSFVVSYLPQYAHSRNALCQKKKKKKLENEMKQMKCKTNKNENNSKHFE